MSFFARLAQRGPTPMSHVTGSGTGASRIDVPSPFVVVQCPFNQDSLAALPATQSLMEVLDGSDYAHVVALRDMQEDV